jgi:hypothetical protein
MCAKDILLKSMINDIFLPSKLIYSSNKAYFIVETEPLIEIQV